MEIVLIDDNEKDIEIVNRNLLKFFKNSFKKISSFSDAKEGLEYINHNSPEIVILDIEMPNLGGFDLLKKAKAEATATEFIFYSSHGEFALEAFKNLAIGFLLKPIAEKDFIYVLTKVINLIYKPKIDLPDKHYNLDYVSQIIPISTLGCTYLTKTRDIVRVESENNYSKIYLISGELYISSNGIAYYENTLKDNPYFFRTHKSHLVNLFWAEKYYPDGTLVMNTGDRIPVARRRKLDLLKGFKK